MYFSIKPSIYSDYGIEEEPRIRRGISFKTGTPISIDPDTPLVFPASNSKDNPPLHFEGISIPVMSNTLFESLRSAGVDNLVGYDALIRNLDTTDEWSGYYAVNILGLIECAALARSKYIELGKRPGSGPPLIRFQNLVIDPALAHGAKLFRLAESPSVILLRDEVWDKLQRTMPADVWGFSVFPVETL